MEFLSARNFDDDSESMLWESLKKALESEPGFAWHKYPITNISGPNLQPDIVILHPRLGINVIEVKSCQIQNIEAIEGSIWYMTDWEIDNIAPLEQATKHMFTIRDKMRDFRSELRTDTGDCKIVAKAFVGLPFITEQDWKHKFPVGLSIPHWNLIFSTHTLYPDNLKKHLFDAPLKQRKLTDTEWDAAVSVMMNSAAISSPPRRPAKKSNSKSAQLRQVEQRMIKFDINQHKFGIQIPDGPQRVRGLAGTGKTVVLAQKAAHMHVTHPDWDILVTFSTQSLYEAIERLITRFVQEFSRGELESPNWDKLHIWHSWGTRNRSGLYREVCEVVDEPFLSWSVAQNEFATRSYRVAFDKCCERLLKRDLPQLFDAVLIDEGQDFAVNYYRLCYEVLRQPKRIIWGYDEVQSLESLEIPTAEQLFGYDADGNPMVDLSGVYPGEIEKDLVLRYCYRNPRPILIAAHAFGLGLLKQGGAIQFIDSVAGWQDIGYEIENAPNGLKTGETVTLYRPPEYSPHILEKLAGYHSLVQLRVCDSREQELIEIAQDIAHNIHEEGLRPDEIVVIALDARKKHTSKDFATLIRELADRKVKAVRIGDDTARDIFRVENAVTITSTYRAKGNEASVVYIYGFESTGVGSDYESITKRNLAFTAMTRAKGWLFITGVGHIAETLFNEIKAILEQPGRVQFIVPNMDTIQRNLETLENKRRRDRAKKAEKTMSQLIKDMADVDPEELSDEQRQKLLQLLLKRRKSENDD